MPKALRYTKTGLYILSAILIFIFHNNFIDYVAYLVGAVIMAYALEEMIYLIIEKRPGETAEALIQLILSALLFIAHDDIIKICIIWGVWSIIREGREATRAIVNFRKQHLATLNIIESIVVTVLSAYMVLDPSDHHAHLHVIILGIELILEVMFPLLEKVIDMAIQKKKQQHSDIPIEWKEEGK